MKTNYVVDMKGSRYDLEELLGSGGQGDVYAVKGGRLAVKILNSRSGRVRERLQHQIAYVRRLPLRDLALAKPLEVLRPPNVGYVMERVTGMVPIKSIMDYGKTSKISVSDYLEKGGLRRRLLLLGRTANILSRLHSRGLAYSDPSPNNIFISENRDFNEVWLIDTDNLRYESSCQKTVYTPGFGAPELVTQKSGVSTLSDAFSFAVIAFKVLTLTHPFIGNIVNNGPPEIEEQAFEGKLPWIYDPKDDSNHSSFGIPKDRVISKRLFNLFDRTFGPGRLDPSVRPGTSEWAETCFGASDATVKCPNCSGTFYFTESNCPWCGTNRPPYLRLYFHIWDPSYLGEGNFLKNSKGKKVVKSQAILTSGETYEITRRNAYGVSDNSIEQPVVSVTYSGNRLRLQCLDGKNYRLHSSDGSFVQDLDSKGKEIEIKPSWLLHFGPEDKIHRVLSFKFFKEKMQ